MNEQEIGEMMIGMGWILTKYITLPLLVSFIIIGLLYHIGRRLLKSSKGNGHE